MSEHTVYVLCRSFHPLTPPPIIGSFIAGMGFMLQLPKHWVVKQGDSRVITHTTTSNLTLIVRTKCIQAGALFFKLSRSARSFQPTAGARTCPQKSYTCRTNERRSTSLLVAPNGVSVTEMSHHRRLFINAGAIFKHATDTRIETFHPPPFYRRA